MLDQQAHELHSSNYRWVMLVLLWLLYICFGIVSRAIFPLVTPILNDLRINYSQMGFILGSWQLTYILTALLIGLALLGFISSPFMSLLLLILMDSPGVDARHMGSAGGMFFCVAEIGGFAGPFFMGVLVDLTGSFMAGALFLAGLCVATAALTYSLRQ